MKKSALVLSAAFVGCCIATAQWTDVTLNPWHSMSSFSPGGTTPNDQRVLSGMTASQAWDLEAVAINYARQEVNLIGGYNFMGYDGPITSIFLSTSVITSVVGSPVNGYQNVSNPGFTYAIKLGTDQRYEVYSLTSSTSVVTAFYNSNRGLPTNFDTAGATLVSSGTFSLVSMVASVFIAESGLSFAGESRYVLTLPLSALQGQPILSYNEWCGNDSLIGNLSVAPTAVPEPSSWTASLVVIGGLVWRGRHLIARNIVA
jgi:hypothetical protein